MGIDQALQASSVVLVVTAEDVVLMRTEIFCIWLVAHEADHTVLIEAVSFGALPPDIEPLPGLFALLRTPLVEKGQYL